MIDTGGAVAGVWADGVSHCFALMGLMVSNRGREKVF